LRRRSTLETVLGPTLGALALAALMIGTGGCNSRTSAPKPEGSAIPLPAPSGSSPAAGSQTAGGAPPMADPHATMDVGATKGLTPQPELDAQIAKLTQKGGAGKQLAALYVKRGNARMMDPQANPHLKYPAALSDYRKALKLDPSNKAAKESKDLIEGIYRGMGRPVPTD